MALLSSWAHAQTYPVKSIRLIAPFSPGASTDVVGRLLAAKLTESWGQTVIVENRPGAGGIVGAAYVAKAPPDGYTLLMGSVGSLGTMACARIPRTIRSRISRRSRSACARECARRASVAAGNQREQLIAFARAHPGELNYASSGVGSPSHLAMEFFNTLAGVQTVHIPFKGPAEATTELLTGRSHIIIQSAVSTLAHLQSGRLRVLATTGSKRMTELPAVPTMIEAGLPGYEVYVR